MFKGKLCQCCHSSTGLKQFYYSTIAIQHYYMLGFRVGKWPSESYVLNTCIIESISYIIYVHKFSIVSIELKGKQALLKLKQRCCCMKSVINQNTWFLY